MKSKVLFLKPWVKLILAGLLWVMSIFFLDIVFKKIGFISNSRVDGLIPFLIASIIFWIIGWCGVNYDKGPMKFLSKM